MPAGNNQRLSDVFRGHRNGKSGLKRINICLPVSRKNELALGQQKNLLPT